MYGIIIINYILDQQEKIISRNFRKQKKKTIYLNFWFFLKSKVILKFRKKKIEETQYTLPKENLKIF